MKDTIFEKLEKLYESDKHYSSKHEEYWRLYSEFLSEINTDEELNILEIGVDNGTGLTALRSIFPSSNLVGLDILNFTERYQNTDVKFYCGSQTDENLLKKINEECGPFDIIIDDASHVSDHQVKTMKFLFPLLKNQGLYIVEDTHTSYMKTPTPNQNLSFIEFVKMLMDQMNIFSWDSNYTLKTEHEETKTEFFSMIDSIRYYPNLIVFKKGKEKWSSQIKNMIEDI
tara:strand:- start:195 stop:878 length:684 start_codon:yes stop_codon:yes gene_type:complete